MHEPRFEQILGVRFFNGSGTDALEFISRNGGYTVVPAAPALANIDRDQDYRRALVESDLAIADSGFMVLLWRILHRRKVVRTSGLEVMKSPQPTLMSHQSTDMTSQTIKWFRFSTRASHHT